MWKANGKTTTLQLFLDSLSPKREKISLEEAMDLSRDRLILELEQRVNIRQSVSMATLNCLMTITNFTLTKLYFTYRTIHLEVPERLINLYIRELYNLHYSSNVIGLTQSWKLSMAGHVARKQEMSNV
jgi:hypothetical protein